MKRLILVALFLPACACSQKKAPTAQDLREKFTLSAQEECVNHTTYIFSEGLVVPKLVAGVPETCGISANVRSPSPAPNPVLSKKRVRNSGS